MTDLKWLEGYSGQTTDELIGLASEYRIDSIVVAFDQALQEKSMTADLNEAEFTVMVVEEVERQVNNGGYHQLFLNAPEYAPYIVEALERISCPIKGKISDTAISCLGLRPPFTAAQVQIALDQDTNRNLVDILDDRCDQPYYRSGESIENRLFGFIRANSRAIGLGP